MGRAPWWLPWSVYGPLGALGACLAWSRQGHVFSASPHALASVGDREALLLGLAFALGLAVTTLASTRWLVRHTLWARTLAAMLRSALLGASQGRLALLAVLSSVSEELFFRAALFPSIGLFASSLVFGALHVASRDAFLPWMLWATLMGAFFALLFSVSGSLWPPILAHAVINYGNMHYLCRSLPSAAASRPREGLPVLLRRL